jgi:hypothetical protein
MDTVYISFARPSVAAVKMIKGPLVFRSFAASIRQQRIDVNLTRVTYCYNFEPRPRCLAFLIGPVAGFVFHRETRRRLAALKPFIEVEQQGQREPTKNALHQLGAGRFEETED